MSTIASPIALSSPTNRSAAPSTRIVSIDALRGLVILLMLVDHTREFFYLHHQVTDPMTLATTTPSLFFTRLSAHLCAPLFVLLTGLAASLHADARGGVKAASSFLLKRGLFLVVLELTIVNFAWTFDPTPATIFLQVIWAIGLAMIALAALVHLPRAAVVAVGLVITLGHNLLDPIAIAPGAPGHTLWAILHDRGFIDLPFGIRARTSYPILPWIGVIALGWGIGPWFARGADPARRAARLVSSGTAALALFVLLRTIDAYGDPTPWTRDPDALATAMSFLNLTKYPPSVDFLLLTLGIGLLLLARLERLPSRALGILAVFGAAPLFFYILHLYALHLLNHLAGLAIGRDGATLVHVTAVWSVWAVAAAVALPCWFACRRFARCDRLVVALPVEQPPTVYCQYNTLGL